MPGTLDGLPVRVITADTLTFNSVGTNALEIDESAKSIFLQADVKQRLRIYNGFYGEIVRANYFGRPKPELKMDVPVFSLAYEITLDCPGGEEIIMSISMVDRVGVPRIADFEIKRGYLWGKRATHKN